MRIEQAAFTKRDAQNLVISFGDILLNCRWLASRWRFGLAFDCVTDIAGATEWKTAGHRNSLNTRKSCDAGDRFVTKGAGFCSIRILRVRQTQSHRQDVVRVITGIDGKQATKALQSEPRHNQSDQKSKTERLEIDADVFDTIQAVGLELDKKIHAPRRQQNSECASGNREQHTFCQ